MAGFLSRALCAVKPKKKHRSQKHALPVVGGEGLPFPQESDFMDYVGTNNSNVMWPSDVPDTIGESDGILSIDVCMKLIQAIDELDEHIKQVNIKGGDRIREATTQNKRYLVLVYNHMFMAYNSPKWCDRDNEGRTGSMDILPAGGSVPNYFANVAHDQTIHRRKILSIAGLRNLVLYGTEIFNEMRDKIFTGDPNTYSSGKGVHKMRYYTGNVVDLDTTVLRASDRVLLGAVNEMNKKMGLESFDGCKSFGNSQQAADIARAAAQDLLLRFQQDFKLSKSTARKRKVDLTDVQSAIPVARSNCDRGKYPLWRYLNAGQDSFHVNVPHLDDVVGALLRAPIQAAKIYLSIHLLASSAKDLEDRLDTFFEECLADACFNQKWKAVEEYSSKLANEGTIVHVLQQVQKEHQIAFIKIMDEDDDNYTKEKELLMTLVKDRHAKSVDRGIRKITKLDISRWIDNPSAVI